MIWAARRKAAGTIEPVRPGDVVDLTPDPWHWQGIVMAGPGTFNLLVALPKVGKTSLLLAMIGAWHHGLQSFLGADLIGTCPPVLIVGTDQPISDWGRMLQEVGLFADGTITAPIVGLYHKGAPLHLDPEGIERIANHAADNPRLVIVLDSIAACVGPLGLDENSAEIVEPINDLLEAISPHGATLVAVHHSSKGRAGQSATMASRGSTALPAAASQIISLDRLASSPGSPQDRRLVLKTEGRGGLPVQILIERTPDGWINHGSAESVALAQHLQEVEEKLTDRQLEVLEHVREQWSNGTRSDSGSVAQIIGGKNGERIALRCLDQLQRRGLLSCTTEVSLQGRRKWFRPTEDRGSDTRAGVYPMCPSCPMCPHPSQSRKASPLDQQIERTHRTDRIRRTHPRARVSYPPPCLLSPVRPVAAPWLPQLLALRDANPAAHPSTLANQLYAKHGIETDGRTVAQLLAAA